MKKLALFFAAVFLSGWVISTASALTISFESQLDENNVLTTTRAGASIWNFNTDALGSLDNNDGFGPFDVVDANTAHIVSGTSGTYAAPFNNSLMTSADSTNYLAVPEDPSTGYLTVDLDKTYNYFGLFWGSIDNYNTIEFFLNDTLVLSRNGLQIKSPADGNQSAPATNTYVNFTGFQFDSFKLSSSQYAFEVDNIAVANVPEPATMLLLGLGLLGFAGARRKFKN